MVIASKEVGEEFARDLPHLIVKTKTSSIFFGQLYDPLDKKLLILRKTKIVAQNGSDVSEIIDGLIAQSVPESEREDYLTIPWDNIEALQIVEKGLYVKPEPETDVETNNEGGTSKKDAPTKPEKHSHEGK